MLHTYYSLLEAKQTMAYIQMFHYSIMKKHLEEAHYHHCNVWK